MSDQNEEEEDWSTFITNSGTTGFAKHEKHLVNIDDQQSLELECVLQLSPVDMMHLYHGTHDATGHRVWMGAYLFVEAVAERALSYDKYFDNKRVLELGCGTGIGGMTVLLKTRPSWVMLTDSDSAVLGICRRNCERNLGVRKENKTASQYYAVDRLVWGEPDECTDEKYDTVVATDVLYDLSALVPLLVTASDSLRPTGYFIVSHVPRASLHNGASVATADELETNITRQARIHGLLLQSTIRPCQLSGWRRDFSLNLVSLNEMEDAGAAILVYEKK